MSRAATPHPLLARQLRQTFGEDVPAGLEPLIAKVDLAYRQADEDRALMERSLELTSQELLARGEMLRALFDGAPFAMGVAEWRDGDLHLVSHNEHARRLFGPPGRRLGLCALPAEVQGQLRGACLEVVHGVTVARLEFGMDAPPRWLSGTVCAAASGSDAARVCYVIEDVTDQRRHLVDLVAQQRLATLGGLAAGVAHEMNNPLAYILSNLTYALEETERLAIPSSDLRAALTESRTGVERVVEIARDLKSVGRQVQTPDDAADLERVLGFACNVAAIEIRPRANLVRDIGPLGVVRGDDTRLGQVFLNLLLNAAQAIAPGDPGRQEVRIAGRRVGSSVVVEVSDSGCGIPESARGRLFEPFFSLRTDRGGTGLGLSICQSIVQGFGGSLELVASMVGVGTTFRVTLPSAEAVDRPTHASSLPPRRGRVLVVDDEPMIRAAVQRVLGAHHDVQVVPGPSAVWSLLTHDAEWDIVLCDLSMPEGDGLTIHRRLLRDHPALAERFTLMTGDVVRRREELNGLTMPILEKPFSASTLRGYVRDWLRSH